MHDYVRLPIVLIQKKLKLSKETPQYQYKTRKIALRTSIHKAIWLF
jgi:hypothetical protein